MELSHVNVLLTGASGFFGKKLAAGLGYNFTTIGRDSGDIKCDLSLGIPLITRRYDLVIHAAGKAHVVPKNQEDKDLFFKVNVMGTEHLLESLERHLPKSFIFISSVSVYGLESGNSIDEETPLLANDAYGLSKIQAEKAVINWCNKNNVLYSILRLPLLVGANPPGNLRSMIKGIQKGYYFNIGGGNARKSMALVDDVVSIIPKLSHVGGIYNLTDGFHPSFRELSFAISQEVHQKEPRNIPYFIAKALAIVGDLFGTKAPITSLKLRKIVSDLTFNDSKARTLLGWQPRQVVKSLNFLKYQ